MRNKIIISLLIGTAISGFSDLATAKKPDGKPGGGKGKPTYCDGQLVNVKGTNKSDTIVINDDNTYTLNGEPPVEFTPPAIVSGGNGNDIITGSVFADIICGGNGQDTISGKDSIDGQDRIFGQNGKDTLYGDDAENSCVAVDPAGEDGILGNEDDVPPNCNDYIEGGNGKDVIEGGDGDDILEGGNAPDEISGGLGSDTIDGGKGKDTCSYSDSDSEDFDDADEEADSEDNECEK